jgi:TIR domain-containing protein
MARNRIFISYSHKDERLFQEFLVHLKPWQDEGILDAWTDKRLQAGQDWHSEIQQGVASAAVAVLLIYFTRL